MGERHRPGKRRISGRTTVIGVLAAVVLLAVAAIVGVNLIAEQQAQRAYDAAGASARAAEQRLVVAERQLEQLREQAIAGHAAATALAAGADAALLTEQSPLARLQESLGKLTEVAAIEADTGEAGAEPGTGGEAASQPKSSARPHETPPDETPQGRDAKQAAAAKLLADSRALAKKSERLEAEARGIKAQISALRKIEFEIVASAYAKGGTLEIPEHAGQETKDAFSAALAALEKPAEDADLAALVQAYQSAWQAVVASNEEALRALDPASIEPTYLRGILVVNKTYALPSWYGDGLTGDTVAAFNAMQAEAASLGLDIYISSGFRSYSSQQSIYNRYAAADGHAAADRYSARPGHSEHQSGLAFDLNSIDESFAYTAEGQWVRDNAHRFGFVIRYPQGKEHITGYIWEPWHLRYLGPGVATELYNSGLSLEEYLGITSQYGN